MAATVEQGGTISALRVLIVKADSSYPSGGYSIPVESLNVVLPASASPGYLAKWDPVARRLQLFDSLTGQTEVADGTNLTGVWARVVAA